MPDCPDDDELAGFLDDSLAGERLSRVSEHVDGCARCQARLDRLTEPGNGAVARYKELASGSLPDSRSGDTPEADTQILGGRPAVAAAFVGLPRVPGFEVMAEIGRGGMGVVYKARHRRLNRPVALKMILAGSAADPRLVQRFLFEAELLGRIQHPQVVQVFEFDTYQGPGGVPIPYLAMELLEGGSLSRKLKEQAAAESTGAPRWPTMRQAAELVEGLARAVHAAHVQGVVHRDLKPGNILFGKDEGGRMKDESEKQEKAAPASSLPKVTDFGLAKFVEAGADLTHSGQIVGTPQYMAPEQAAGAKQVGPAADVYALGAILYECLAGRPPFTGTEPISVLLKVVNEPPPDVRSLCPEVPRDLAAVTMKCLEKEPGRRYASAEALADDLRRFLDDRPTRARPVTTFERLRLWRRRNPAVAGLLTVLAGVLLTAFVTFAALWLKAEGKAEDERLAKRDAELARQRAEREAANAAASLAEVRRQKALLEFGRAVVSCEEGRVGDGLALFLQAAEIAEQTGQADLARVARVNLAAWPRDLPPAPHPLAHAEQPRLAAFHPDGKRVVTAGRGGELYLWSLEGREKLRTYKAVPRLRPIIYWTVAISPDGNTIAAGGGDSAITLWDINSPQPRATIEAASGDENVWSLGFAPDGSLWANDGKNGLKRWNVRTRKAEAHLTPGQLGGVLQILLVSPDGSRVYSGDRAGMVREWDAQKGELLRSWRISGWVTDLALSPDGARLAATGPEGFVRVLDLASWKETLELSLAGAYGNGVAFAQKSPFLVATDGDGNVRFWHRDTGQPVGIPMRFNGEVTRPRFRAGTDEFAVPAGDAVYLCSVPDPPGDLISPGHGQRIRGMDFSPNGDRLAVVDDDDNFELFDPLGGKRLQLAPRTGKGVLALRFDADPSRPFVYRGTREDVERLAVPGGKKAEPIRAAVWMGRIHRVESLPGAGGLYVMGEALVARFNPVSLERLAVVKPAKDIPAGVTLDTMAVRPDGKELLVAFANRVVTLKGDTLEFVREWRTGDEVLDMRYTPDGTRVLIGRRDNVAELLDAESGLPVARSMSHTRAVAAVAVSTDGKVLLTGSRDGTARFWDAATGLPLAAPLRHTGPVTHVAFSPKGDHVATGTGTGHVMLWDLPPNPAAGTIEELRPRLRK